MKLTPDMEQKVRRALTQYSEYQVANIYGLRVATVRAIKLNMQEEATSKGLQVDFIKRRQQEILIEELARTATGSIKGDQWGTVRSRWQGNPASLQNLPKLDYVGLEARVLAGFFTPNGQPTPAFWGYISQYVKKSGHTMLDILHDQEIYAPEQLERALDIDSQLEDMSPEQLASLLQRVSKKVYENAIADPTGPGANVSDGE